MRNLFFLLGISMVFLYACAKEDITDNSLDNITVENRAPLPKLDVCHFDAEYSTWHVINISMNAWPAHEAHGDVRLDDPDNDGFYPNNECGYEPMGDCNDFDATVYPGAEEICGDGIDQDCNGIDPSCVTACWAPVYSEIIADLENDGILDMSRTEEWIGITTGHCENGVSYSFYVWGTECTYIINSHGSQSIYSFVISVEEFVVLYQQIYDLAVAYNYPVPAYDYDLWICCGCPEDFQSGSVSEMSSRSSVITMDQKTGKLNFENQ